MCLNLIDKEKKKGAVMFYIYWLTFSSLRDITV